MSELKQIETEKIKPHPKNPRLYIRDDVVDAIRAGIISRGEYGKEHAILVRPMPDYFEIISGHHRLEAAKKAGLQQIPAWVRVMDDDEAYMELLLTNSQKELASIETGLHALRYAEKLQVGAGAGNKGGLSEYAERVGINRTTLTFYMNAADVYLNCYMCNNLINRYTCDNLFDKTRHLSEIHAAPKEVWPAMVDYLLSNDNVTVALIKTKTKEINKLRDAIPDWWVSVDVLAVLEMAIKDPKELKRLMVLFNEASDIFDEFKIIEIWKERITNTKVTRNGREYFLVEYDQVEYDPGAKFISKLNEFEALPKVDAIRDIKSAIKTHIGFNIVKGPDVTPVLSDEEQKVVEEEHKRKEEEAETELLLSRLYKGDCLTGLRYWSGRIDLLLTDPPYGMDFQSNRRTATEKSDKINNDNKKEALDLIDKMLSIAVPKMGEDSHAIIFTGDELAGEFKGIIEKNGLEFKSFLVWDKANHGSGDLEGSFAPKHELAIHAVKGSPKVSPRIPTVFSTPKKEIETSHPTEKPISMLKSWIECTTLEGDTVVDPFMGTGATIVSAHQVGRKFWGSEMDESYFSEAKERLLKKNG